MPGNVREAQGLGFRVRESSDAVCCGAGCGLKETFLSRLVMAVSKVG